MSRLYFSVFFGKKTHYHHAPHESPLTMSIPLMILATITLFAGYVPLHEFVTSDGKAFDAVFHWNIAIPVTLLAFCGMGLAFVMYYKESTIADKITSSLGGVYTAAYRKFYIDEVYMFVTKKIMFGMISRPIAWFDRHIIDATMNGIAAVTVYASTSIKGLQSGQLQKYGFVFVSGAILLAAVFMLLWAK